MKTQVIYQESYQSKQGFGARLIFITFLLSLIGLSKVFAQVPANDSCGGAISLTPSATCNFISGTTTNATQSIAANCGGVSDDDVWYSFVASATNHLVSVQGATGFDAVIDIRSGNCSTASNILCSDATGDGGGEVANLSGLTIGNTYFVRVYHWGNGSGSGNFQICVSDALETPIATTADSIFCTSFNANWTAVTNATTYYLDVSTDALFSSFVSGYSNLNVGNVTTFNVNGLTSGAFYYRVRASDGINTSLNSNMIAAYVNGCGSLAFDNGNFLGLLSDGDTVSLICELRFGLIDSIGGDYPNYIVTSNFSDSIIYYNYFDFSSQPEAPMSHLLGDVDLFHHFNISAGWHTLYLVDLAQNLVADSINLFFSNPVQNNISYSAGTLGSNGNYSYNITGLDSTVNYLIRYRGNDGWVSDTIYINNSSSVAINYQYNYDGAFHASVDVFALGCNSFPFGGYDYYPNVNNTGCSSARIDDAPITNNNYCNLDSISFEGQFSYSGLSSSGTSTLSVNWGDGLSDSYLMSHSGSTDSSFYFYGNAHNYSFPGTYTTMVIFYDANACHVDTLIQSITIGSTTCGTLTGTVYSDINTNCSLDNGTDVGVINQLITATDANSSVYYAWTDYNGNYAFNYLPNGTYTVDLGYLNQGYSVTCSGAFPQTVTINGNSQVADCPVTCSGAFDVAVTGISLMNGFFPGTDDAILPHVGILNAACNQPSVAGQVMIILDACIQYTTNGWGFGNSVPDAIHTASTGDTLIWNVSDINNIGTFSYWDYAVNVSTCTSAQVGDSACITVMVLPTNGDADLSNNTFTRCFAIGVSYDPNSKEVSPKGVGAQGYIPATEPSLTYTLNFQNTGTATARNIYVMDTIDSNLNPNSIEILSASHRLQVYTLPNGVVKFMFADIMLADSTHNELESHGYVTFKIKLNQGLTPGTEIKNTGYIYFDYNDPIVTNTTLNTMELPSSVKTYSKLSAMKVYPNPAKESITILSGSSNAGIVTVLDVLGKTVQEVKTSSEQTVLSVSELPNGVYFVKLAQDNVVRTEKILIAR